MQNNLKTKKILNIFTTVLVYLFFVICLVTLVLSIIVKKDDDGAINISDTQMRIVVSDSMAKCDLTDVSEYEIKSIPIRSMIFIELVPEDEQAKEQWYKNLKKGDVLVFKYVYVKQETITHRIVDIYQDNNGGYTIHLEGDNKNSDTSTLSQTIYTSQENTPNFVVGKVTGQNYILGFLVSLIKSPVGIICIIIIPCLIIMILEIFRIIKVVNDKKDTDKAESEKQKELEIEQLKKQLAEYQKKEQANLDQHKENE